MASRFERDIRAVNKGLVQGVERSIAEMALSVFSSVVISTPVDTGRARGNWQPSIREPITSEISGTDKSGQPTISKARSNFGRFEVGQTIFISNNVPYIERLNEGHSSQAPAGFVQKAIQAGIQNLDQQRDLFS